MEMKGLMGGFYRISEWIMRFSVTNLLWLLTSIPILLLLITGYSSYNIEGDINVIWTTLILIAILTPFTLFPSTSAMFSLARKWIIGEEDVPLFKTFFINYKRTYLQSMVGGLFYTLLFIILFVNYRFYLNQDGYLQFLSSLFIALMVITSISIFNFFSMQSHLHMKNLALVKNAILITVGKPLTSIAVVITNIAIVYICFSFFNSFLAFFFMGSFVAYMSFFHFHRMFQKIQDKQEELLEAQQKHDEEQMELGASDHNVDEKK